MRPAHHVSADVADAAMTADRDEEKHLAPAHVLPPFLRVLKANLPIHHYAGKDRNGLPGPQHFVTTVYFDTKARSFYQSAMLNTEHNVKVRAKEYYDVHPALAELATDTRQIVRHQRAIWLELKRREGTRTHKHRVRIDRTLVPSLFRGEALNTQALSIESSHDLEQIERFCHNEPEPLVASALVNYRRMSFQDEEGLLRVTVDLDIAFYAPPEDVWTRAEVLSRTRLGKPCGVETRALIEVKRRAPAPTWLTAGLEQAGVTKVAFSKFVSASEAIHGKR